MPKRSIDTGADAGAPISEEIAAIVPLGTALPAGIPPDVFAYALNAYVSCQRLDMQALARQLNVGRATLYRKVGNRDRLMDAVIAWRERNVIVAALHSSREQTGIDLIVTVLAKVLHAIRQDAGMKYLLDSDPKATLQIVTGSTSLVQETSVSALQRLIMRETERESFSTDLEPSTLAHAIVRICDGFLYADLISDRPADVQTALVVVEALLRGLDMSG